MADILDISKNVLVNPHNTTVLFGSYGIVPSSEMFIIQEIASALIAGVIVVVVDWKRLLRRPKS
jgi:hypothetical protein